MRQKKKNKIILILIILLIIFIILLGLAYVFFKTDTFKSNKELFLKYTAQIVDEKEGFIDYQIKQYFEKRKNTPYSNEGTIAVNITSQNGQEQFKNTNNMNITFEGQVDTANSKSIQNISLNYSDDVKFPLTYKQIDKTIGIQTKYIGSKFVSIDIDKMENSENSTTELSNSLEKIQELLNINLSQEEFQYIKETYINKLSQQLPDTNFSNVEENGSNGYKLSLNGQEFKNIIIKLLEILKEDKQTLDKLNEYIQIQEDSSRITSNDIENIIEDIYYDSEIENKNIEITIYQKNGKTSSFNIKIDETIVQFNKNITGNDIQYNIKIEVNNEGKEIAKIGFTAKFAGFQSMQSVTENYELSLQYKSSNILQESYDIKENEDIISMEEEANNKYKYSFSNEVNFIENANIETFSEDTTLMLSDVDEEQINQFIMAVIERIQNVNKMQMEELGLEESENPLFYAIPQLGTSSMLWSFNNSSNISEEEVSEFNEKFEKYESTNLKGVTVKGLLTTISRNNGLEDTDENLEEASSESNKYLIKEIHFDGEEYEITSKNILLIKSTIETEEEYRVEFERDEDTGIIYRAVINKK